MLRRIMVLVSLLLTVCVCAGDIPLTSDDPFFVQNHSRFSHPLDEMWKNKGMTEHDIDRVLAKRNLPERQNKMEKMEVEIGGKKFEAYLINTCFGRWRFDGKADYKYLKGTFYTEGQFKIHELSVVVDSLTTAMQKWEKMDAVRKFKRGDSPFIKRNPLYSFCLELPKRFQVMTMETRTFQLTNVPPSIYVMNLRLTNSKEPDEIDKQIYEVEQQLHKELHLKNAYDIAGMPVTVTEEDSYERLLKRQAGDLEADVVEALIPTKKNPKSSNRPVNTDAAAKDGKVSF